MATITHKLVLAQAPTEGVPTSQLKEGDVVRDAQNRKRALVKVLAPTKSQPKRKVWAWVSYATHVPLPTEVPAGEVWTLIGKSVKRAETSAQFGERMKAEKAARKTTQADPKAAALAELRSQLDSIQAAIAAL